jgi:hypothetical protein
MGLVATKRNDAIWTTVVAQVVKASRKDAYGGQKIHRWKITDGSLDRDNDRINPHGWDFTDFWKSPSVLAKHDYGEWPIGRALTIETIGDAVYSDCLYADTPEALTVWTLVESEFINACSVGFRPLEFEPNGLGGTDFIRQSLLEWSIVPVGANANAVVQRSKALGLDAAIVQKMFGGRAQTKHGARHSAADREVLTEAYKAIEGLYAMHKGERAAADVRHTSIDFLRKAMRRLGIDPSTGGDNSGDGTLDVILDDPQRSYRSLPSSRYVTRKRADDVVLDLADDKDFVLDLVDDRRRGTERTIDGIDVKAVLLRAVKDGIREHFSPANIKRETERAMPIARGRID